MKFDIKLNSNVISYTGNVEITKYSNGKKIGSVKTHNTGTIYLYNFIAESLAGRFKFNSRPARLQLKNGNDDVGYKIMYYQANATDNICTLMFIVPGTIFDGKTIDGLELHSADSSGLALATTELSYPITGDRSINYEIKWHLEISGGSNV